MYLWIHCAQMLYFLKKEKMKRNDGLDAMKSALLDTSKQQKDDDDKSATTTTTCSNSDVCVCVCFLHGILARKRLSRR